MANYPNIERLNWIKEYILFQHRNKKAILAHLNQKLSDKGIDKGISAKTLERDFKVLDDLGYTVNYLAGIGYRLEEDSNYEFELLERYHKYLKVSKLPISGYDDSLITSPIIAGIDLLPQLFEAIRGNYTISFDYLKYKEQQITNRLINPLTIKEYNGEWHILGIDSGQPKTFGLDRISNVVLKEKFDTIIIESYNDDIELFKKRLGAAMPLKGYEKPQFIKLGYSSFLLPYLKSKPLHYTQTITSEVCDDYTLVSFVLVPNLDLIKHIVSGLGDIVVVEPKSLKSYIKKHFKDLISIVTK